VGFVVSPGPHATRRATEEAGGGTHTHTQTYRRYPLQSQGSHFSSILTMRVLISQLLPPPRLVAHWTFSTSWWPQLYWLTILMHMVVVVVVVEVVPGEVVPVVLVMLAMLVMLVAAARAAAGQRDGGDRRKSEVGWELWCSAACRGGGVEARQRPKLSVGFGGQQREAGGGKKEEAAVQCAAGSNGPRTGRREVDGAGPATRER
jgi:hypothetical protein